MTSLSFPPPLAPGSRVRVVAPSGTVPRTALLRGLAWLRDRYEIVPSPGLLDRAGYLAGSDATRARALRDAFEDPRAGAIWIARGGYGATRITRGLPWETLARAPKWLVGFSDATALHVEAMAHGVASIHGPNVTGLGSDPWTRACLLRALEHADRPVRWSGLRAVRPGAAEGTLVGGNLSIVCAMATAGRWRPPRGAILALEDVTERPYRLDRMLTSLLEGGHLSQVSGIVLGEFAQCEPGADAVSAAEVLDERTRALGVAVVAGAPFGHGDRNDAFTLGARARILEGGTVEIG